MLIFHEGLPGSGKSYAAFEDHIIPALKKSRKVFAYIEGLDFARIAQASDLTPEKVSELLVQITREQVPDIHKHVQNDALVVIDELQNFWPNERKKLDDEITKFVTEHRHRGLDVLCMGQVMTDCHKLWTNRVDTKIAFMKMDAIGKPNEYRYAVFKRDSAMKMREVTSGKKPYDPKYFGCYKSHEDGTENKGTYTDERANVWNSKVMKRLKLAGVVAVVAIGYVVWAFQNGLGMAETKPSQVKLDPQKIAEMEHKKAVEQNKAPVKVPGGRAVASDASGDSFFIQDSDFVDSLNEKGRIRLAGVVRGAKMKVALEWRDSSLRLVERLSSDDLELLGWRVMVSTSGAVAVVMKPGRTFVATQWPLQDDRASMPERVPGETIRQLREGSSPAPAPVAASSPSSSPQPAVVAPPRSGGSSSSGGGGSSAGASERSLPLRQPGSLPAVGFSSG